MSTPTIYHPTDRPNYTHVYTGDGISYAFSYRTCVGAQYGAWRITRENVWGPTTGKHLNDWDGGRKRLRLPAETFALELRRMQQRASEDGAR